jgi:hypothetical protein
MDVLLTPGAAHGGGSRTSPSSSAPRPPTWWRSTPRWSAVRRCRPAAGVDAALPPLPVGVPVGEGLPRLHPGPGALPGGRHARAGGGAARAREAVRGHCRPPGWRVRALRRRRRARGRGGVARGGGLARLRAPQRERVLGPWRSSTRACPSTASGST